jgi:hypothetical protein
VLSLLLCSDLPRLVICYDRHETRSAKKTKCSGAEERTKDTSSPNRQGNAKQSTWHQAQAIRRLFGAVGIVFGCYKSKFGYNHVVGIAVYILIKITKRNFLQVHPDGRQEKNILLTCP